MFQKFGFLGCLLDGAGSTPKIRQLVMLGLDTTVVT